MRIGTIRALAGKLHGLTVTDANLNYDGSITLDPLHCSLASIKPLEFVDIWNLSNGSRITTYVILGDAGSNCCILNGAAARSCQIGDKIIVCATSFCEPDDVYSMRPKVVQFGPDNVVENVLAYECSKGVESDGFRIESSE